MNKNSLTKDTMKTEPSSIHSTELGSFFLYSRKRSCLKSVKRFKMNSTCVLKDRPMKIETRLSNQDIMTPKSDYVIILI